MTILLEEHPGAVTFKGQPLTLVGKQIRVGDKAPNFHVVDNSMNVVEFSNFKGKNCIISAVPSLDTPVCDTQTHHFNDAASKLNKDLVILTISMDLPFAQSRWCGAADVHSVSTLSDYREASFGQTYGILIKEWRLLGRGVFLIDKQGTIRYTQYVKEISQLPDFNSILEEASKLA